MSGAIFGMIHCLAWHFQFPSLPEQILWRVSSSILIGICLCMLAAAILHSLGINFCLKRNSKPSSPPSSIDPVKAAKTTDKFRLAALTIRSTVRIAKNPPSRRDIVLEVVWSILAVCFVLARLSLLVLSIVELRALPASAFDTVRWSGFIPHI